MKNEKKLSVFLFIFFIIPGLPKDLLVYLAALTPISSLHFFTLLLVGRLPWLIASVVFGTTIHQEQYGVAILITVISILAFGIGYLYKNKWIELFSKSEKEDCSTLFKLLSKYDESKREELPMQIIETNRLRLRNFSATDAQGFLEYAANPRVNCFLSDKVSTLEEAVLKVQERSCEDSHLAVCLKESNALIGELFYLQEEPDTFSVGWNFNARYEGMGYARESTEAFFHYLFTQKEARRLYAYVEDDNVRSQKLCEKLGMRKEGCFIEFISFTNYEDGTPKYENTFQYALLKREWLGSVSN